MSMKEEEEQERFDLSMSIPMHERMETLYSRVEKGVAVIRTITAAPEGTHRVPLPLRLDEASRLLGKSKTWVKQLTDENDLLSDREPGTQRHYSPSEMYELRHKHEWGPLPPKDSRAIVIAIVNQKGGVGKTTTTVTFAQDLVRRGYRVLLIDYDAQASSTASMLISQHPIAHYLSAAAAGEDASPVLLPADRLYLEEDQTIGPILLDETDNIRGLIRYTHWENLHIIPSAPDLDAVGMDLVAEYAEQGKSESVFQDPKKKRRETFLRMLEATHDLKETEYDIILMDCAPSMSLLSVVSMPALDGLIIPTPARNYDIASLKGYLSTSSNWLEIIYNSKNHLIAKKTPPLIRFVVTQYVSTSDTEDRNFAILEEALGTMLVSTPVPRNEAFSRSSGGSPSIYEEPPESPVTAARSAKQARNQMLGVHNELIESISAVWDTWRHRAAEGKKLKEKSA